MLEVKKLPKDARIPFLRGAVWEQLAYLSLRSVLKPNQALLSPRETQSLFSHPHAKAVHFNHIQSTVPDGILLEQSVDITYFVGSCEYTALHSLKNTKKKVKQVVLHNEGQAIKEIFTYQDRAWKEALGAFIHERFPHLPPELGFDEARHVAIYVMPPEANLPSTVQGGVIHRLPISTGQLDQVIRALLNDFRIKFRF